jgi:hypothetical protein
MKMNRLAMCGSIFLVLAVGSSIPAFASGISFTCDSTIDATVSGTCGTLNSTIAGLYNSSFTNANASIYVTYGVTGLGQSTTGFQNQVSYSAYRNALTATSSGSAVDTAALDSLNSLDTAIYGTRNVEITSALGTALGLSGMIGTTVAANACFTPGTGGCYNGIITITNDPATPLYFRSGTQNSDSYDFFSVVEHEVDEVLGTSSCIGTTGGSLSNDCSGVDTPSAVDLFRYTGEGALANPLLTTSAAYFSYDAGVTKVADYNHTANGDDYGDFLTGCGNSGARIQDATACPGQGGLNITNDGGAEISILDAIGYNRTANVSSTPEPGTLGMLGFGFGLIAIGVLHRR